MGCHSRGTRTSGWPPSIGKEIAVIVKGEKVRLIHDMRRDGNNSKVQLEERLVLPRLKDIVEGVMKLMANNGEGIEFLTSISAMR